MLKCCLPVLSRCKASRILCQKFALFPWEDTVSLHSADRSAVTETRQRVFVTPPLPPPLNVVYKYVWHTCQQFAGHNLRQQASHSPLLSRTLIFATYSKCRSSFFCCRKFFFRGRGEEVASSGCSSVCLVTSHLTHNLVHAYFWATNSLKTCFNKIIINLHFCF